MYKGDRSRKSNLSDYGFRLPSCKDNRPLKFDEWVKFKGQTIYVSATPGPWELEKTKGVFIEQIVRPTGLVEPNCKIHSSKNQIEDLIEECRKFIKKGLRILVTTLTKKYAEKITDYFNELSISAKYMHSDIDAIERIELIRNLRLGEFDVLVGINLLREGLDIPECGLVAILDADKEGFLRSKVSLIQTIGRAARNVSGEVILYADKKTKSINSALEETDRRRLKQEEYNKLNNIIPTSTSRKIIDILEEDRTYKSKKILMNNKLVGDNLFKHIKALKVSMMEYAENLDFEKAAQVRDEIKKLENNEIGV